MRGILANRTSARQRPGREEGDGARSRRGATLEHDRVAETPPAFDAESEAQRPDRKRRRRRRRPSLRWAVLLVLLGVVVALGVLVLLGVAGLRAYPAAADLLAGRDAMVAGRRAVVGGEMEDASAAFTRASASFAEAEEQLNDRLVRAATAVPIAGRSFTAVADLAVAGRVLGDAALQVSKGLEALPEGALTLAPDDGVIPLEPLEQMQPVLQSALETVGEAGRVIATSPQSMLAPPVRDAQRQLVEQLQEGEDALTAAEGLARALPPFLGAEDRRRYFFGAANPAEVRGTGGLIGSYAILTADGGELELSEFATTGKLPVLASEDVAAPNEDFARRYDQFGGAGFLSNINMTPDFPSAAVAIENHYERATGERLDGVVVVDPFALEALLELTGPARVPGIGTIAAEGVVPFLANRAYETFDDKTQRQSVLGDVAEAVLDRFLAGEIMAPPATVLMTLGEAAGARRLQFHASDDAVQEGLHAAGLTGGLPSTSEGDFLAVVPNNGAANKADYFMGWRVDYEVWLEEGGGARAQVKVEGHNGTPQKGPRRYVIGPNVDYLQAGDNLTYLTILCDVGCEHSHAKQNDAQQFWRGAEEDTELGFTTLSSWQWASSESTTDMQYTLQLDDVWDDTGIEGGSYVLRLQTPPLAQPAEFNVAIHPPHPLQVGEVSSPLEVVQGQAVWNGQLERPMQLHVDLRRPSRNAIAYRLRDYAERVKEFWRRPL